MKRFELNDCLLDIARAYASVAQEVLGPELTSVVLFGSVARREATEQSDIDLLVICRRLPRGTWRRRELLATVHERLAEQLGSLWEEGLQVELVDIVKTEEEAQRRRWLYLDMTEDVVLLYDRRDFFAGVLRGLRERLEALGSQRKRLGKVRYWDLKPDFMPGEVFEL